MRFAGSIPTASTGLVMTLSPLSTATQKLPTHVLRYQRCAQRSLVARPEQGEGGTHPEALIPWSGGVQPYLPRFRVAQGGGSEALKHNPLNSAKSEQSHTGGDVSL